MVSINIQKKDLFLISAITVFLIGSGIVIATNSGSTILNGHTYDEVGIPACGNGQVLKWSGGSWACGNDNIGGVGTLSCKSNNQAGERAYCDVGYRATGCSAGLNKGSWKIYYDGSRYYCDTNQPDSDWTEVICCKIV